MAGAAAFCLAVSALVAAFARPLMEIFVPAGETEILAVGIQYLRIEGSCYIGIGLLFLLYGLYRGLERAQMSILLTVVSLGVRVALAYALAPIPRHRPAGHLVGDPHRVAAGGPDRLPLVRPAVEAAALPAGAAGIIGLAL